MGPRNPQSPPTGLCPPDCGPSSVLILPVWLCADPDAVSLEAADRPNFFLHVTANGSLEMAKWQRGETFHCHASFLLHRGTWQPGHMAIESLAKPGSFLMVAGPTLNLRLYEHTEAFRWGTLFRLLGRCPPPPAFSTALSILTLNLPDKDPSLSGHPDTGEERRQTQPP